MKHQLATTKNVTRFMSALTDLIERPHGIEGMGLLWGQPGEGKSTVIASGVNTCNGLLVRANVGWTVTSMLKTLVKELGGDPEKMNRRAELIEEVVRLEGDLDPDKGNRPIFIDEADYLLRQGDMLDALRDIYDNTGVPIIFVGMEDLGRKLANNPRYSRFARRITQWVEFAGIDLDDSREVANTMCQVGLADDLLEHVHDKTSANIGRMVTALAMIQKMGRTSKLEEVTLADWGDRPLFYGQPPFRSRGK